MANVLAKLIHPRMKKSREESLQRLSARLAMMIYLRMQKSRNESLRRLSARLVVLHFPSGVT